MVERLLCTQEVRSSILLGSIMVSEAKAVAALVCGTSHSGFDPRQTPQMEDTAEWTATRLEI